ncbi:MAG: flavin reductase (DIM6/NTAB) family NADH-FMN oxidoreductase RutF [Cryomorphaceae bacterium]|jgi:flavin reductase (DIM6/NTAB) family NADH-FMN oxidoreductase RutF
MFLDFNNLTANQCYGAMVQTIVPRPIAWVLSDNGDDSFNVAPFSFFTGISSEPALLMLSVGMKNSIEEKDTRANIRDRDYFVVHISSTRHLDSLNATSATLPHGESEVELADIELAEIEGFCLPRIVDCDIAIACKLYRIDEIGDVPQAVIYGEIVSMTVSDHLLVPHERGHFQIDAQQLDPLARLGGSQYSGIGGVLAATRPK